MFTEMNNTYIHRDSLLLQYHTQSCEPLANDLLRMLNHIYLNIIHEHILNTAASQIERGLQLGTLT